MMRCWETACYAWWLYCGASFMFLAVLWFMLYTRSPLASYMDVLEISFRLKCVLMRVPSSSK